MQLARTNEQIRSYTYRELHTIQANDHWDGYGDDKVKILTMQPLRG